MPILAALVLSALAAAEPLLPSHDQGPPAEVHAAAGAWLVETGGAVVVVDPPAGADELRALKARIESLHKPLAAVLLTHAPEDGGEALSTLGEVEVVCLQALSAALPSLSPRAVREKEPGVFGGAHFVAHDLGSGATAHDAVWVLLGKRPEAFVGALVQAGAPKAKDPARWIEELERAKRLLYGLTRVYPGRGEPGGYALLERQRKALARGMLPVK